MLISGNVIEEILYLALAWDDGKHYTRIHEAQRELTQLRAQAMQAAELVSAVVALNEYEITLRSCPVCNFAPAECDCAYQQIRAWLAAHAPQE